MSERDHFNFMKTVYGERKASVVAHGRRSRAERKEKPEMSLVTIFENLMVVSRVAIREGLSQTPKSLGKFFDEEKVLEKYFDLQAAGVDTKGKMYVEAGWPEKPETSWMSEAVDLRNYVTGVSNSLDSKTEAWLERITLRRDKVERMKREVVEVMDELAENRREYTLAEREALEIVCDYHSMVREEKNRKSQSGRK